MGYTHYFPHMRDFTPREWERFTDAVTRIVAASDAPVCSEYDIPHVPPRIGPDFVAFNGQGANGHETFMVYRQVGELAKRWDYYAEQWRTEGQIFVFCKTAMKPYDVNVVACLIAAHAIAPGALAISSDGGPDEWQPGMALAGRALPSLPLTIPAGVIE